MFWYSYRGLEPRLQRAHAGHTQVHAANRLPFVGRKSEPGQAAAVTPPAFCALRAWQVPRQRLGSRVVHAGPRQSVADAGRCQRNETRILHVLRFHGIISCGHPYRAGVAFTRREDPRSDGCRS